MRPKFLAMTGLCEGYCELYSCTYTCKQIRLTYRDILTNANYQNHQSTDPSRSMAGRIHDRLVDLLDSWASAATRSRTGAWHATHVAAASTGSLVHFHHDGIHDALDLLLLGLELILLGKLVLVQPVQSLLHGSLDLLLVTSLELVGKLLLCEGVAHGEAVVLETVFGLDLATVLLILSTELLGLLNHAIDLRLRQTALLVGDGDLVGLASGLVLSGDIKDTVGFNVEGHLDLRNATWRWWDAIKVELAEQVVVLGHGTLTLEDLDENSRLVVSVGSESLTLLGGDGGVALNELGHDATRGLKTHGKRSHIQEEQVLHLRGTLTSEDGRLDSSAVSDGLIRVDGAVWLLAVEELLNHSLDLRDTSGAAHQHDLVHIALVDATVAQALLDWTHGVAEVVHVELLEASTREGAGEVDTIEKRVDLDGCLSRRGQGALGALALSTETTNGTVVASNILAAVLALEILHAEVDNAVVEVLAAKVRVACSGLHLENAVLDGEDGDIEGTTSHVIDQDVLLSCTLLVETICDGGSGRLVDDTKHVHARNGASILGGLTLGVVEVSWHGDHCVIDLAAQVRFRGLLHLQQDHGGDLLRVELLGLAIRFDTNHRLVALARLTLERPKLDVSLHGRVRKLAADQALCIEDSVLRVAGRLILGGITDKTFCVCKRHIRRSGAVALIVGDDLNTVVLPHTDAGVRRAQVDADRLLLRHDVSRS